MKRQSGFTLIELMIVVAIIGILAAIALPAYTRYQAKAKVTAGLAEISAMKTGMEDKINQGDSPVKAADLGAAAESSVNCSAYKVSSTASAGTAQITCTITNAPSVVTGKTITLNRVSPGTWSCSTQVDTDYQPKGCSTGS